MAFKLTQSIIINAPIDQVFATLTDFANYSCWNPWIVAINGECRAGDFVKVTANMGGKQQLFQHRIETVEAPHYFHWSDIGWFTVLACGERKRELTLLTSGEVSYHVELSITGPLAWLVRILYRQRLNYGLESETQALKDYIAKSDRR